MSTEDAVEGSQQALLEEAMDWLMRLRDVPCEPSTTEHWQAWVQTSAAHLVAWNRICRTWDLLGQQPSGLASQPRIEAQTSTRVPRASRLGIRTSALRSCAMGLGVLAVLLLSIALGPAIQMRLDADFLTSNGETRVVTLEDGSAVTLAPDSAIAQDMDDGVRRVRLLAGEAFFDVTRDVSKPFLVEAQDTEIRVVGTAFNVQETEDTTRVELAHGAIMLRPHSRNDREIALVPGDVVSINRRTGKAEKSHIDPQEIALWREGHLAVTDQSVATVVGLIQRHHPAWIVVTDRRLNDLRVSGLYDVTHPDKALEALVQPFGLKVRAVSSHLRVISAH